MKWLLRERRREVGGRKRAGRENEDEASGIGGRARVRVEIPFDLSVFGNRSGVHLCDYCHNEMRMYLINVKRYQNMESM